MLTALSYPMIRGSLLSSGRWSNTISTKLRCLNDLNTVWMSFRQVGHTFSFLYQSERHPPQLRCWQGAISTGSCIKSQQMPHSSSSTILLKKPSFAAYLLAASSASSNFCRLLGSESGTFNESSTNSFSRSFSTLEACELDYSGS